MVLEKLTLGETVVWDREIYPTILPDMVNQYGEGPFKVVGLRLWTKNGQGTGVAPYQVTIETPTGVQVGLAGEWVQRP